MSPQRPPHAALDLGPLEAEVLQLVWDIGEAAVDDVHRRLLQQRDIAYTTVMTVMSRLAAKGVLKRRKEGRAYVYRAAVRRHEAALSSVRAWADRYFGGQVLPAVTFLLGQEQVAADDIEKLRELLDRLDRGESGEGGESEEPKR